jgi:hypothetical protein
LNQNWRAQEHSSICYGLEKNELSTTCSYSPTKGNQINARTGVTRGKDIISIYLLNKNKIACEQKTTRYTLRQSSFWKGEEPNKVSGGHCLVNWPMVCMPKELGGLGILDLEGSARALHLRWVVVQTVVELGMNPRGAILL